MDIFVYNREHNTLLPLSDYEEFTLAYKVFLLKLSNVDLSDNPDFEHAYERKDDFIFLTQEDIDEVVKSSLSMRNPLQDNITFQRKFGFDVNPPTKENIDFRMELLKEEYEETLEAYANKDPEEFVDGLIDLVVIALGTLHLSGVDANKAWSEVYRANMSKERGIKPGREQSGGFDVYKPEGWVAPDHSDNHGELPSIWKK